MRPANNLPHSHQRSAGPSWSNAVSIWGLVVLVAVVSAFCNGAIPNCLR